MRTETKWAAIAAIALFLWLVLEKFLGLHNPMNFKTWLIVDGIFSILLFAFVFFMVTKEKRDQELGGVMTWIEGFWAAAIMTLIFIPLSSLLVHIVGNYISPTFPAVFAEKACPAMSGKDPVSTFMISHVIIALLGGLLFSLIFPIFTKRSA